MDKGEFIGLFHPLSWDKRKLIPAETVSWQRRTMTRATKCHDHVRGANR